MASINSPIVAERLDMWQGVKVGKYRRLIAFSAAIVVVGAVVSSGISIAVGTDSSLRAIMTANGFFLLGTYVFLYAWAIVWNAWIEKFGDPAERVERGEVLGILSLILVEMAFLLHCASYSVINIIAGEIFEIEIVLIFAYLFLNLYFFSRKATMLYIEKLFLRVQTKIIRIKRRRHGFRMRGGKLG